MSLSVSAVVLNGTATITDITVNSSQYFNFTTGALGTGGHFYLDNVTSHPVIHNTSSAKLMHLGFYSNNYAGGDFNSTLLKVPNATFTDFFGDSLFYGHAPSDTVFKGHMTAFKVSNSSGSYYGVIFVREYNEGQNLTFLWKFNTHKNNNTFGAIPSTGCAAHTNFTACLSDVANNCEWVGTSQICRSFSGENFEEHPGAECDMLPKAGCDSVSNDFCIWNATKGTNGLCQRGTNFSEGVGFNCTQIINATFCTNQSFTDKTGLCSWNGTACKLNKSKTFNDVPKPPVFSCGAEGYVDNQTACENLATTYFLPCGWDNKTNKCDDLFFDFSKFDDFNDIGTESTCQSMGGTWKQETTFDPLTNKVTTEKWCEVGVTVKSFDHSGTDFGGSAGQLSTCDNDCFACEYNGTKAWSTANSSNAACTNSAAGCVWRNDSNALNGFGWCDPVSFGGGFGEGGCDSFCGDCMFMPDPQNACTSSVAGCKWDNATSKCLAKGRKSCNQDCLQCFDQTSCTASAANCQFVNGLCTPRSGQYEICYDGLDNDQNGKTDCEDFKCSSDPFCVGDNFDTSNCFQYLNATSCAAGINCTWINEGFNEYCAPISEQCWRNDTLKTSAALCNGFNGGETCKFSSGGFCDVNFTMQETCFQKQTFQDCNGATGCVWNAKLNFCDFKPFNACEQNQSLQLDQAACQAAGCVWVGGQFEGGSFETGGYVSNCVNPCLNFSITDANKCAAANGSTFASGICAWSAGTCEPKHFGGFNCFDNDGDVSACRENSGCSWFEQLPYGSLRNPNGSTSFDDYLNPSSSWLAIGLQKPRNKTNESIYILNSTGGTFIKLEMSKDNSTTLKPNLSRLYCNNTLVMEFNWSSGTSGNCNVGICDAYNYTMCAGYKLHHFLNSSTNTLEVLWEMPFSRLVLDTKEGNVNVTTTVNTSTVIVDGNLSEHIHENASVQDGPYGLTNATRVKTSPGFCDPGLVNTFFAGIDEEPPLPIATDATNASGGVGEPSAAYLDIQGIGMKKTPEAYAYGISMRSMAEAALCRGVPISGSSPGQGTNTSKYYLYLDTDGNSTNGCYPRDNSSQTGFEYYFSYVVKLNTSTFKVMETLTAKTCSNSSWVATNIGVKGDKKKACDFVGGPIFAVDKDGLIGKPNVNTSIGWRVYATTASDTGNATNVQDRIGPSIGDFKGVDVDIIDCASTADKDNAACSTFKQFGFFPGEFGPACIDSKDNDGDGDVDCADADCKYDPFFCSSDSNYVVLGQVDPNDKTSPSFQWNKVNKRHPNRLEFVFDTNEPSNGTVRWYANDSKCRTLNSTLNDTALEDGNNYTNFRTGHVAGISSLDANTTYFYKFRACDPSGNCAVSACKNVTTASSHSNITFKLLIPTNWTVDIPIINLTNYSADYAIKASTKYLTDINISMNKTGGFSFTFVGISIFEKQTINLSGFISDATLLGMDANQFQNFKQKTGLEKVVVKIPTPNGTAANKTEHCDDNGANCKDVSSTLNCTYNENFTTCIVPDAVGLGFSTYKSSTTAASASSSSSSSSSSSGGGGSGGSSKGGSAATTAATTTKLKKTFDQVGAGKTAIMSITSTAIAVKKLLVTVKNEVTKMSLTVQSLDGKPATIAVDPTGKVYKYVEITKENLENSNIQDAKVQFEVSDNWMTDNGVSKEDIRLFRWTGSWDELATRWINSQNGMHNFEAVTPGFSTFAIASVKPQVKAQGSAEESEPAAEEASEEPRDAVTGEATAKPEEELQAAEEEPSGGFNPTTVVVIVGAIVLLMIVAVIVTHRKKYE